MVSIKPLHISARNFDDDGGSKVDMEDGWRIDDGDAGDDDVCDDDDGDDDDDDDASAWSHSMASIYL